MSYKNQPVVITAATTLKPETHGDTVTVLDSATGRIITLPASTGKGDEYTVFVKTTVSSGSHVVQVANSTDVMSGGVGLTTDIAGSTMPTSASTDTITMNGSTTGGLLGSWMRFTDVAAGFWKLEGSLNCTGTEATPFSAAV